MSNGIRDEHAINELQMALSQGWIFQLLDRMIERVKGTRRLRYIRTENCPETFSTFMKFLEGTLPPEESGDFAEHSIECAYCSWTLKMFIQVIQSPTPEWVVPEPTAEDEQRKLEEAIRDIIEEETLKDE